MQLTLAGVVEAEPAGTEPVSEREPVSLPVPQKLVGAVHSIRDAIQARKLHEIKTSGTWFASNCGPEWKLAEYSDCCCGTTDVCSGGLG